MPDAKSCSDCHQLNCYHEDKIYPKFCLTEALDRVRLEEIAAIYRGDGIDGRMARAAAEVEGTYYGQLTRVEETLAFARRIGAKRIGIATCVGLIEETRVVVRFLQLGGMEVFTVLCKVGALDKTEIGVPESGKVKPGARESCCNPIQQAELLNAQKTDLNVIVGLCVGHDALFAKHSDAPVTTLIAKDRVMGHNPVAAIYTAQTYGKRLFDAERVAAL